MHFDYHIFNGAHLDMAWSSFEQFRKQNLTQIDLCDYFYVKLVINLVNFTKFNNNLSKMAMWLTDGTLIDLV